MRHLLVKASAILAAMLLGSSAQAACCYFSAKNADVLQPAQKAFLTWDPQTQSESFTVQPRFEGNALDFGMVIPTPSQPKLHEMPRDFFKHLAIYTVLKHRQYPKSKLLPLGGKGGFGAPGKKLAKGGGGDATDSKEVPARPPVIVLETGVVGSLDYKIIKAERADDLYQWLKDNKYSYSGDEATLDHYVKKNWYFTVMKIDTMQMKKNKDGSYAGEVTPTRFSFTSDKLVYPLKITQISVKDKTEALFYVQAPGKMDLPGDMTYQFTWVPMLQGSSRHISTKQPGRGSQWLQSVQDAIPPLLMRAGELQFAFVRGQRPVPNRDGRTPTTMEWARKLTEDDIKVLTGALPYGDKLPDVDEGFTKADVSDPQKRDAALKVIRDRLLKARQAKPQGYLVRTAPANDLKALAELTGHVRAGLFITKFRKIFTRSEMDDDLTLIAARLGPYDDTSEYEEILPASPP